MGESFIGGLILSCVQSFIYDISAGACKGPIWPSEHTNFSIRECEPVYECFGKYIL